MIIGLGLFIGFRAWGLGLEAVELRVSELPEIRSNLITGDLHICYRGGLQDLRPHAGAPKIRDSVKPAPLKP